MKANHPISAWIVLFVLLTLNAQRSTVLAQPIWYEGFNYADGPIISNSAGLWIRHSGFANPSDAIVRNHKLENSATGGTLSRSDDVHRFLTSNTNTPTVLYASFTMSCTNLPNAAGGYFAHFCVNDTMFHARVYALIPL